MASALGLLVLGGIGLPAQESGPAQAPAGVAGSAVITSVGEFWNLSEADKRKPLPLRMDLEVFYYDPAWKLLYGQTDGVASYLPVQGRALPIKSGQKVRLQGTVIHLEGLDGARVTASVLADIGWPVPLPTAGRMTDTATLNGRWVQIEGYVLSQNESDPTHVEMRLWSEGRTLDLIVQINATEPVPQLVNARVRVRGVYDAALDTLGNIQRMQIWTEGMDRQLEVLGWLADDERFKLPRTPLDQLAAAKQPWVRVVGEVRAQEPGKSLTVRDESGQIVIPTTQTVLPPQSTTVEIIGRPAPGGIGWTLHEMLFRPAGPSAGPRLTLQTPGEPPVRLRLAEQVLELPPEIAERRYPVTLNGVVTWADERADFFYLQDTSGGVRVRRQPGQGEVPPIGTSLVLTGNTLRGSHVHEVEMVAVSAVGTVALPSARSVTLEQALSGAEEGQRVEMRAYVRQVTLEKGWTRLDLTSQTGEFAAYLPEDISLENLQGSLVRVRGVSNALVNVNREPTDIRLWVQGREAVLVDEPKPADPFTGPMQTIAGLRQFTAGQLLNHRVRLTGQVLLHQPGRHLYLQDEGGGLFVLTREAGRLQPGDRVEVVGFPGRAGSRLVLREAVWRTVPSGPVIAPEPLASVDVLRPEADAHLVSFPAVLRQTVTEGTHIRLTLQAGDTVFDALLHDTAGWVRPATGSRLELTGVYVVEFDEYRRPHGFRLELRTPADVRVLASPPWWTARRTGYAAGGLALFTVLIVTWIMVLRRRVREQTEQIRRQLEKEARLQTELERSSRLESLGVLAGGIAHDFNNLLTVILGNLGLVAMNKQVMTAVGEFIAEAERGAHRARDITQQLLTFAQGGDPVRTSVRLPDVVNEAASFALHGSKVRFDFDCPPDLPPGDVDAGQISRVIHNLVINAVQAMPEGGIVSIALAPVTLGPGEMSTLRAGAYVRLTLTDTGKGIPPENLTKIFDPYFSTKAGAGNSGLGLAAVRSIIKKHLGHIEVESQVGAGTTFRIWLPAATQVVSSQASETPWAKGQGPARVLVMDDEDVIRRLAGRMLALAGHETVFASDGAEAVRTYTAGRESGHAFDLVIFDLTVPGGMGGKDALQELLKTDPHILAIASSGYSNDPVMANPRSFGFCTSLPKPYDIPDLVKAVEEARRQ